MPSDIKQEIGAEALRIVTGARRAAYGPPEQNFQRIADFWMIYFRAKGWTIAKVDVGAGPGETFDAHLRSWDNKIQPIDVAAMMRLMKEARLAETPNHRDSYVDLVGYALCGAEVAGVEPSVEPEAPPAPRPLVIETGKFYRTRDGRKRGPAARQDHRHYPWLVDSEAYQDNGRWRSDDSEEPLDLIAEWSDAS